MGMCRWILLRAIESCSFFYKSAIWHQDKFYAEFCVFSIISCFITYAFIAVQCMNMSHIWKLESKHYRKNSKHNILQRKQGKKVFKSYCLPMLTFVFVFTRKSGNTAKWSPEAGGGATMLSCQLPPLLAEGSKNCVVLY